MPSLSEHRSMKDAFYKTSVQSPLTTEQRKTFTALRYFDENPALRFTLALERYENPRKIHMATSTGHEADFEHYGHVQFVVNGEPQELQVYRGDGQDQLFVPFTDATTGNETYGGGRYLDVDEQLNGTVIVDFNQAYNPYCAYDPERWSCPIPPKENRLTVRIEAGEKLFDLSGQ